MEIQAKLSKYPISHSIWEEYALDQEINDRGVMLDMPLVHNAIRADELTRSKLMQTLREITDLDNPNSVTQMKRWLAEQGLELESLGKKEVAEALESKPGRLTVALEMRQSLSKSSVKKYIAMDNCVCADGRARGLFQYYGANRTGRAAGRLIQAQNLPQTHLQGLEQARALVCQGNYEAIEMLYPCTLDVLSQLIRTAFVPSEGKKLIVADFSSIEAVVLGCLAGERWVLDAYSKGQDLYIKNAERMFNAKPGSVDKKSPLRQKSKIAVLACGYSGSVGALKAFGAVKMSIAEKDLQGIVDAWRSANPAIVKYWWDCDADECFLQVSQNRN